ncbi:MAG: 50S ribosomal protein L11 methyltransferase [Taibaiella sp.]|nr:50S ribosomal protein L11 methyltransferase [Taibaiella sp.]
MTSIKIKFNNVNEEQQEILVAQLAETGFEGFEQQDDTLFAYIDAERYNEEELAGIAGLNFEKEVIDPQNWNQLWESNFEPVIIDEFCTIRADFHTLEVTTPHEIVITPKMSFGTGHHATTQLMIMLMKNIDFKEKQVLDFGTGTGVLAILAEKLGAYYVLGIDNDEWCVTNANENLERNGCTKTTVMQVTDPHLPGIVHDIILANINRNILLQYMPELFLNTRRGGMILLSGLLREDGDIVAQAAASAGFNFIERRELNNWIALAFKK